MNEGLKADEKKDLSQFQNGIDTRLGIEMYQNEPIRTAEGTKVSACLLSRQDSPDLYYCSPREC
jgi:hypothetical protein